MSPVAHARAAFGPERRFGVFLGLLLILGGVISAVTGGLAQTSQEEKATGYEVLLQALSTQDEIRVIARMDRAGAEPDQKPSLEEIGRLQSRLISKMRTNGYSYSKPIRNVAAVVFVVDVRGLELLATDDAVTSLHLDKLNRLFTSDSTQIINANIAWALGYEGTDQVVAILDTGVDGTNHNFDIVAEGCFSTHDPPHKTSLCPNQAQAVTGPGTGANCPLTLTGCDHGTHVAGIAASLTSPTDSAASTAPATDIVAIQVFTDVASCAPSGNPCIGAYDSDLNAALQYVSDLVPVLAALPQPKSIAAVNMSLGGGQFSGPCDTDPNANATLAEMVNLRNVHGIAPIAASGNDSFKTAMGSPACLTHVISIGATQKDDAAAEFSNSAPNLDFFAPGVGISSSEAGTAGAVSQDGTSMAAPHVAGCWALLKQQNPLASVAAIASLLDSTGTPVTDPPAGITKPRINCAEALASQPGQTEQICGRKCEDVNGNGQCETGEPGLQGWTIEVIKVTGGIEATEVTDANGEYCVDVPVGNYRIEEVLYQPQSAWDQTSPLTLEAVAGPPPIPPADDLDFSNTPDFCRAGETLTQFEMATRNNFAGELGPPLLHASIHTYLNQEVYNLPGQFVVDTVTGNPVMMDFDLVGPSEVDKPFSHFFDISSVPANEQISRARLEIGIRPNGGDSHNDNIVLAFVSPTGNGLLGNPTYWYRRIGTDSAATGILPEAWDVSNYWQRQILRLELGSLPVSGAPLNVLGDLLYELDANRHVDLFIQDDTAVDYGVLTICSHEPDIEVSKTFSDNQVGLNTTTAFKIEVSTGANAVAIPPNQIVVEDIVPSGLDLTTPPSQAAYGNNWDCDLMTPPPANNPDAISCKWLGGSVPSGTTLDTITVDVETVEAGTYENCAIVRVFDGDGVQIDHDWGCDVIEIGHDVGIAKSIENGTLDHVGATADFVLQVTNYAQPIDHPNETIVVTDTIPNGFTIVPPFNPPPPWSCTDSFDPTTGETDVICTYSASVAGGTTTPLIEENHIDLPQLIIPVEVVQVGIYLNCATVTLQGVTDDDPENDENCVRVTIPGDVQITKTSNVSELNVGDDNEFYLDIVNLDGSIGNPPVEILVTDAVPPGYLLTDASGPGWDCQPISPPDVACSYLGPYPVGSAFMLPTITIEADATTPGEYVNCATVTLHQAVVPPAPDSGGFIPPVDGGDDDEQGDDQTSAGQDLAEDTDCDTTIIGHDVSIAKASSVSSLGLGDTGTYTLTVTNHLRTIDPPNEGLVVSDSVPVGLNIDSFNNLPDWDCMLVPSGSNNLQCSYQGGQVSMGDVLPAISIGISPQIAGTYTNCANVQLTGAVDDVPANNASPDCPTVVVEADIAITKGADVSEVAVGQGVQYTLVVSNQGVAIDGNVTIDVTDSLPSGFDVSTVTALPALDWLCPPPLPGSGDIDCTYIGALPIASSAALGTITVQANAPSTPGQYTNCTDVAITGVIDGNPINNKDCATVTVGHDVSIAKSSDVSQLGLGETGTFTLTVTNHARTIDPPAEGLVVSDSVPVGLNIDSFNNLPDWDCQVVPPGSNDLECTYIGGQVATGAVLPEITLVVSPLTVGTYDNCANVALNGVDDDDPANNASPDCPTVVVEADLAITKQASETALAVGQSFDYVMTVSNAGVAIDGNVVIAVTDSLPTGIGVNSVSAQPPTYWNCPSPPPGSGDIACTYIGGLPIASGSQLGTITVQAQAPVTAGQQQNCAAVAITGAVDGEPVNDVACEDIDVDFRFEITKEVVACVPPTTPQKICSFRFHIQNTSFVPFNGFLAISDFITESGDLSTVAYNLPTGWTCTPAVPGAYSSGLSLATCENLNVVNLQPGVPVIIELLPEFAWISQDLTENCVSLYYGGTGTYDPQVHAGIDPLNTTWPTSCVPVFKPPPPPEWYIIKDFVSCDPDYLTCQFDVTIGNDGGPYYGVVGFYDLADTLFSDFSAVTPTSSGLSNYWSCIGPGPVPGAPANVGPVTSSQISSCLGIDSVTPTSPLTFSVTLSSQDELLAGSTNCAFLAVGGQLPSTTAQLGQLLNDCAVVPHPELIIEKELLSCTPTAQPGIHDCDFEVKVTNVGTGDYTGNLVLADAINGSVSGLSLSSLTVPLNCSTYPISSLDLSAGTINVQSVEGCEASVDIPPNNGFEVFTASADVDVGTNFGPPPSPLQNCVAMSHDLIPDGTPVEDLPSDCVEIPVPELVVDKELVSCAPTTQPNIESCDFEITVTNIGTGDYSGSLHLGDGINGSVSGLSVTSTMVSPLTCNTLPPVPVPPFLWPLSVGGINTQTVEVCSASSVPIDAFNDFVTFSATAEVDIGTNFGPSPGPLQNCVVMSHDLIAPGTTMGDLPADCVEISAPVLTISKELISCTPTTQANIESCDFKITVTNTGTSDYNGALHVGDAVNGSLSDLSVLSSTTIPFTCSAFPATPTMPFPLPLSSGPINTAGLDICSANTVPISAFGGFVELTATVDVDVMTNFGPAPNPLQNCALMTHDPIAAGTAIADLPDACVEIPAPELSIVKEAASTTCEPGQLCTFTVSITNNGSGDFTGLLSMSDTTTPAGLPLVGWGPSPWDCQAASYPYVCETTTPLMIPHGGGSTDLTLKFTVPVGFQYGSFDNCVELFSASGNPIATACDGIQVPAPQLSIDKNSSLTQCPSGGSCTFTVTIANNGAPFAGSLAVLDTNNLPGTTVQSTAVVGSVGNWSPPTQLNCALPHPAPTCHTGPIVNMPSGSSVTYSFVLEVATGPGGYALNNCVELFDGAGNQLDDDCYDVTITAPPEITVDKEPIDPQCEPGETCTFKVAITNSGGPYSGVLQLFDSSISTGLTLQSQQPAVAVGWTAPPAICIGGLPQPMPATCTTGPVTMPPNSSVVYTFTLGIPASFTDNSIENCVELSDGAGQLIGHDCVRVDVVGPLKSVDGAVGAPGPMTCTAGEACLVSFVLRSFGPSAFGGLTGLDFDASIPGARPAGVVEPGWSCAPSDRAMACRKQLPELPPGAAAQVTLNLAVSRDARPGRYKACATLNWDASGPPRDLRAVQRELSRRGYDPGPADGAMGPRTRGAIRAFQGDRGLAITGRADEALKRALFGVPRTGDSNPANDGACTEIELRQAKVRAPDLWIKMGHSPTPFSYGGTGQLTFNVGNLGPVSTGGSILLEDRLPVGLTVPVGAFPGGVWNCGGLQPTPNGQDFNCQFNEDLRPNQSLELVVPVRVAARSRFPSGANRVRSCARVFVKGLGIDADPEPNNNRVCDEIRLVQETPARLNLAVKKRIEQAPQRVGDTLVTFVDVYNLGPAEIAERSRIVVDDKAPRLLTALSADGRNWSCSGPTPIRCTYTGPMPVGTGRLPAIQIVRRLDVMPPGGRATTCSKLSAQNAPPDIDPSDNEACVEVRVAEPLGNPPDLAIALEAPSMPWKIGQRARLTLHNKNTGGLVSPPAVVRIYVDPLPGIRMIGYPKQGPWQCGSSNQGVFCSYVRGPIGTGSGPPLHIEVAVEKAPPRGTPLCARIVAEGAQPDRNPSDNRSCIAVQLADIAPQGGPDLSTALRVPAGLPKPGTLEGILVNVENHGAPAPVAVFVITALPIELAPSRVPSGNPWDCRIAGKGPYQVQCRFTGSRGIPQGALPQIVLAVKPGKQQRGGLPRVCARAEVQGQPSDLRPENNQVCAEIGRAGKTQLTPKYLIQDLQKLLQPQ